MNAARPQRVEPGVNAAQMLLEDTQALGRCARQLGTGEPGLAVKRALTCRDLGERLVERIAQARRRQRWRFMVAPGGGAVGGAAMRGFASGKQLIEPAVEARQCARDLTRRLVIAC